MITVSWIIHFASQHYKGFACRQSADMLLSTYKLVTLMCNTVISIFYCALKCLVALIHLGSYITCIVVLATVICAYQTMAFHSVFELTRSRVCIKMTFTETCEGSDVCGHWFKIVVIRFYMCFKALLKVLITGTACISNDCTNNSYCYKIELYTITIVNFLHIIILDKKVYILIDYG